MAYTYTCIFCGAGVHPVQQTGPQHGQAAGMRRLLGPPTDPEFDGEWTVDVGDLRGDDGGKTVS